MPEGLGVVYVEIKERRRPEEEVQEEETGSGFKSVRRVAQRFKQRNAS